MAHRRARGDEVGAGVVFGPGSEAGLFCGEVAEGFVGGGVVVCCHLAPARGAAFVVCRFHQEGVSGVERGEVVDVAVEFFCGDVSI